MGGVGGGACMRACEYWDKGGGGTLCVYVLFCGTLTNQLLCFMLFLSCWRCVSSFSSPFGLNKMYFLYNNALTT